MAFVICQILRSFPAFLHFIVLTDICLKFVDFLNLSSFLLKTGTSSQVISHSESRAVTVMHELRTEVNRATRGEQQQRLPDERSGRIKRQKAA